MALKMNKSANQAPFFPPGIAHHKVVSTISNSKAFSSKRPQTVKECKMLSKNKDSRMSSSLMDSADHSNGLRRFSNSTPNLKVCHISNNGPSIHKHNCNMGIIEPGNFRASPMPAYYACESLGRNRSMLDSYNGKNKTRSLDRLSSTKKSTKNLTGFLPEKPFYPPSKYPNIHDKKDGNIQRLIETRDKYKTPESRKTARQVARRQSMSSLDKRNNNNSTKTTLDRTTNLKKSQNYGSVPNITKKNKNMKSKISDSDKGAFTDLYGDQMAYTSELGPYRISNKLDLEMSDGVDRTPSNDMYTSYFYPKPIPNQRAPDNPNDRMAQSLICERSLASLIFTGSLDRANRNEQYRQYMEMPDVDDSPTKSVSARKRVNSFSQDSLDGRKSNKKAQSDGVKEGAVDGGKSTGVSCDEMSLNSELDKSTTMSQIEDDELKTLCSNNSDLHASSRPNYLVNSNWDRSDLSGHFDQYNLDQHTKPQVNVNDLSSFVCSDENNPISIRNEFITNREHSIIGKDDQTLLSNLASKCIVSTDHHYDRMFLSNTGSTKDDPLSRDPHDAGNDQGFFDSIVSDKNSNCDRIFVTTNNDLTGITDLTSGKNGVNSAHHKQANDGGCSGDKYDAYHVTKYGDNKDNHSLLIGKAPTTSINTDHSSGHVVLTPKNELSVGARDMIFGNENYEDRIFEGHNDVTGCIQSNVPMNESYTIGKDEFGNTCNRDGSLLNNTRNPDNIYDSTFFSSLNIQFNGFDSNDRHDRNASNPHIGLSGDEDVSESSSTNELSWSGYEDNSLPNQRRGVPWVSSPDLHSAHCNLVRRPDRHLQSENPLKPLCSFCHKPAYFMERISISNIIFHKSCFRCRKCYTHLNFNNCIIHRNRAYCLVHVRSKIWKSVRSASTNKLSQIKARLDNRTTMHRQSSTETKQQKRIFYEGINSAKSKFFEDVTKLKDGQQRDPKRITPPRQGFNSGIIESEPKPRDPNIIAGRDSQTSYLDEMAMLTQSSSAKETRARFKELQQRSNGPKDTLNGDAEESILTRRSDVVAVDTKSLRDRFLTGANDSETKLRKINPADDIQRLTKQDANSIYKNEPESRTDVEKSDSPKDDETVSPISRSKAKELKEKFSNFGQNETPKKSEFKLDYGEGGVYESNPQENHEDVIRHNYDNTVHLPENTVKSGLQRIKELQDIKSQGYQKPNKDPIKIESDPSLSGIYENTPEQSRADSISCQNEASLIEFREKNYTNDAKKVLMEKQKQEEEAALKRSTPHMIDIWKDLCPDSGVFENQPQEQRKDVAKYDYNSDELITQSNGNEINEEDLHTSSDNHSATALTL